jgi:hypothetical protein
VMNNPRIEGDERLFLNEDKQAIACMDTYMKHLRKVSEQFAITCTTDDIVTFRCNPGEDTNDTYTLKIRLVGVFEQDVKLIYQEKIWGPFGDEASIKCKLRWKNTTVNEEKPLDIKYLEGSKVHQLQLQVPKNPLQHSFTLHTTSIHDQKRRDEPTELNKFREAAWVTVAMMRRIFLINRVHYAPIAHVIHPIRKDVGLFNHIPSDLRRRIVQMYINSLRTDMTNALQSIKDSASLADGPLPDPF